MYWAMTCQLERTCCLLLTPRSYPQNCPTLPPLLRLRHLRRLLLHRQQTRSYLSQQGPLPT